MAIPILKTWQNYFSNPDEGLGSSYERIILNNKLNQICSHFKIKSVLEAPSFGFTGLSGINSMDMAKNGLDVAVVDNDNNRLDLIKAVWEQASLKVRLIFTEDFNNLPFEDNSIDLSWNFSALWFVDDLSGFLSELNRISRKVILLCVPNRNGIGYISQKYFGKEDLKKYLKEENIIPNEIKKQMKKLNWELIDHKYIDCPPWPDIGMPKEKFLKIFGLNWLLPKQIEKPSLSIMDYYSDKKPDFADDMMQHAWFEKRAPNFIKRYWAHHQYLLFIPKNNEK